MAEECLWLVGAEGLVNEATEVLVVAILQMIEERRKRVRKSQGRDGGEGDKGRLTTVLGFILLYSQVCLATSLGHLVSLVECS